MKKSSKQPEARNVIDELPEEVQVEILCKLPIKCLLICTSVCKSWYSLIKNPNFISTHLHKILSSNTSNKLFLHRFYIDDYRKYYLRIDHKDFGEKMAVHPPFHPDDCFHIAGSCNGLICLFRDDFIYNMSRYIFILWNPSIRKSLFLPQPHFLFASHDKRCKNFVGIGFDSRTHDYKVLRMMNPPVEDWSHFRTEVYSLNANSWKNITHIAPKYGVYNNVVPAFVNGALHWAVTNWKKNRRSLVMVFDVRDEVFREIMLPECLVDVSASDLTVDVFGESTIAVIHQHWNDSYQSHIWVMKEYGVVASWVKVATASGKRWRGRSKVLGFRSNGDVLMEFSYGGLASLNLVNQRIKSLRAVDKRGNSFLYSYVESLALLDKGNDIGTATDTSSESDAE